MSKSAAISIIVPVYNVEKYAKFCFDSLVNQTLKDIEIILVDDGALDSSGAICDEYAKKDPRVKVIHQKNRGLGLSRNSGLKIATGEYVGFVDSDDCVSLNMFQVLYENARKYKADISYCSYQKFTNDNEIELGENTFSNIKIWSGKSQINQYMLDRVGMPPKSKVDKLYGASVCCGIFLRKRLTDMNAQFVSERQFIAEDMVFDIDVIPNCETIVHTDAKLYFYRWNPDSLTTVYKQDRFEKNVELYHEMYHRLSKYFTQEECYLSISRYLLTVARIAIIQEARFVYKNGKDHALCRIAEICSCQEIREILYKYPYWQLPLKYSIFCWLEKLQNAKILLWITRYLYRPGGC